MHVGGVNVVKLQFQVVSVASSIQFEGVRVILQPVPTLTGGAENLSLFKGAPSGSIELLVTTTLGVQFFEIGKRYSVSIDPV